MNQNQSNDRTYVPRGSISTGSHKYKLLFKNVAVGGVLMMLGEAFAEQIRFCLGKYQMFGLVDNVNEKNKSEVPVTNKSTDNSNDFEKLQKCWEKREFSTKYLEIMKICMFFHSIFPMNLPASFSYLILYCIKCGML